MNTRPLKKQIAFYNSLFTHRKQIMELLEDLRDTYPYLSTNGDYKALRVANARHAAMAKGILAVIEACEAYPMKEDAI